MQENITVVRFDSDICSEYKRSAKRSLCKNLSKAGEYLESMKEIFESLEWK